MLQIFLIQVVDKLIQFDLDLRMLKYKVEIKKSNAGFTAEVSLILKEVPNFVKFMKEYFFKIKIKRKEYRRVHTKCLLLHN